MVFFVFIGVIWALAIAAWFLVSKYVKSSDLDRIKARLAGTTKNKPKKDKAGNGAGASVIQQEQVVKNRLAQMLVQKWGLGPKLAVILEQAGLNWPPARFVHLTLMCFGIG